MPEMMNERTVDNSENPALALCRAHSQSLQRIEESNEKIMRALMGDISDPETKPGIMARMGNAEREIIGLKQAEQAKKKYGVVVIGALLALLGSGIAALVSKVFK